jgi:hypothetical protein
MAGEWIKMRASLHTDPKVMAIGRYLERQDDFCQWFTADATCGVFLCDVALRYVVTGALHNAWCNVNEHSVTRAVTRCNEAFIAGAGLDWIDTVTGIQHFGDAMASVGWARADKDGLCFPKFNHHNTSGAERQRRYRAKKSGLCDVTSNVTGDVTGDGALRPREEKRREKKTREEKKETEPPIVPQGGQERASTKRFVPPTLEEVSSYCAERKNGIDPQEFMDHYKANGWRCGKGVGKPMKDWKAAVHTWENMRKHDGESGRKSIWKDQEGEWPDL